MNKVSKSIKKFRTASGMTQTELADKLFVTRQTISSWENGRTQPDIETIALLSKALSVSIEELIYGEKPKLVDDGKNENARKVMITVFSILASLLVGVGGVLVFVNYWYEFPKILKIIFAFLPMLIGQATGVFVIMKKYDRVSWREGASVLWCSGVAATIALTSSVLSLRFGVERCLLADTLLFIPVIYILDAVSPLIACYIMSIAYGVIVAETSRTVLMPVIITLLLVLLGVLYVYLHRRESTDSRHTYTIYITLLAFLSVSVMCGFLCEELLFAPIIAAILIMYSLKDRWNLLVPVRTLMPVAFLISSVFITYILNPSYLPDGYTEISFGILIIIVASFAMALAALILLIKENKKDKPGVIYAVTGFMLFLCSVILFRDGVAGEFYAYAIVFIIAMIQGVAAILIGVKENRFLPLNTGLLTIIALIMEIIFAQDFDSVIIGLIMIFFGACLFVINYRLAKKGKEVTTEAVSDEKE